MYRNIKSYELRYTDVDAYDNLKLSSLLSFLEESACFSADELGFGYKDVAPRGIGFIIINWYIKLERPIKLGEILEVHTWPLKPKFSIFLRDYEIYINGERVGVATARWCMIDTKEFKILPVSAFFDGQSFDGYNTERSTDFNKWKIHSEVEGVKVYSKKVRYSDYDHYFHVNNTKYADFLLDVFSVDELRIPFDVIQITYNKQCKEGEIIDFVRKDIDGYVIIEGVVDGELRVQLKASRNV